MRARHHRFDRYLLVLVLCGVPSLFAASPPAGAIGESFDLIIQGGRVLDGSGNPWVYADVGIKKGRIAAVGRLRQTAAVRTIDARGRFVVPGFIDIHSHADDEDGPKGSLRDPDRRRRAAANIVTQGVTTVTVNPDGSCPWPVHDQRTTLEALGTGVNTVLLVGHNTVRRQVMGEDSRRAATPTEIKQMGALIRQGLDEGALGLSSALEYPPGIWATTDEMVALARELLPFDGVLIQHERSSGVAPMWWKPSRDPAGPPTVLDAVREGIEIAERAGARVVLTHMKARGTLFWGTAPAAIRMITQARGRGVQVYGDHYPYTTSGSDGSVVLIPDWALGTGGTRPAGVAEEFAAALRTTITEPLAASQVRRDVEHEIEFRGGAENIIVFEYPDAATVGKSLAALAAARGISAADMAIALQLEGFPNRRGGGRLRSFSFWEPDIEALSTPTWMATASDGDLALPEDGPGVHPRFYGTFTRMIRRYALDRGVISLEHAVRSATSLPARILGLRDRGEIREGFHADVAVIDLATLTDRATFTEPHQYSAGVDYVLVGGHLVVDGGKPTWALPGRVITRDDVTVPKDAR